MELEREYMEYVGVFSLAFFATSASYFIDLGTPLTFAVALMIPILFGYTAYISREGFNKASLLSLPALIFALLGPITGIMALVIGIGNVLVSVFGGGKRFRDFYSSTTIPLLLIGFLVGGAVFAHVSSNPQKFSEPISESIGSQTESIVEDAELISGQRDIQLDALEQTSRATVQTTEAYVINQTAGDLSEQDLDILGAAFESARSEIPGRVRTKAESDLNLSIDISDKVSDVVQTNFKGKLLLAIIPLIGFSIYSLQPLLGLLTAISAAFFRYLES